MPSPGPVVGGDLAAGNGDLAARGVVVLPDGVLPVALINVESGNYGAVNYGLLLSGAVIAMIPCVVVYVALQRFYVRGLVSGALKG